MQHFAPICGTRANGIVGVQEAKGTRDRTLKPRERQRRNVNKWVLRWISGGYLGEGARAAACAAGLPFGTL